MAASCPKAGSAAAPMLSASAAAPMAEIVLPNMVVSSDVNPPVETACAPLDRLLQPPNRWIIDLLSGYRLNRYGISQTTSIGRIGSAGRRGLILRGNNGSPA